MAKYTPRDGSLAEQFSKGDGSPVSAVDLTWSYASAITAFGARGEVGVGVGWGAGGLRVDDSCLRDGGCYV